MYASYATVSSTPGTGNRVREGGGQVPGEGGADAGDEARADTSCGVLYGTLRDSAYKLRHLAEQEIEAHKESGLWDLKERQS